MLHRLGLSLVALATALSISTIAHADPALVCGDYLSGDYQPDELPPASQALAEAARACICDTSCAHLCSIPDGEGGRTCMLNATVAFGNLGGDGDACGYCEAVRCMAPILACIAD